MITLKITRAPFVQEMALNRVVAFVCVSFVTHPSHRTTAAGPVRFCPVDETNRGSVSAWKSLAKIFSASYLMSGLIMQFRLRFTIGAQNNVAVSTDDIANELHGDRGTLHSSYEKFGFAAWLTSKFRLLFLPYKLNGFSCYRLS